MLRSEGWLNSDIPLLNINIVKHLLWNAFAYIRGSNLEIFTSSSFQFEIIFKVFFLEKRWIKIIFSILVNMSRFLSIAVLLFDLKNANSRTRLRDFNWFCCDYEISGILCTNFTNSLLPNNFKPIFFDKKKRKLLILKRFHDAIHK